MSKSAPRPASKQVALLAGLSLLLLTSGCFDTKEDFTLNPDGSGKVVHECTFQTITLGDQTQDPEAALRGAVRDLIEHCKGVEAWRDVSFKQLEDGRFYFRGTAYFKNLSSLDIPNQTLLEFNWKRTANGSGILDLRTNHSAGPEMMSASGDGSMRVSVEAKPELPAAKPLSPEELSRKIKQERMQFQQSKPMLTAFLGTMRQTVSFHVPGEVSLSSNFTRDPSGALTVKLDGTKLLSVMEGLVNDDHWCREHAGTGFASVQEKPVMDDEVNGMLFGEKAPVRATVGAGGAPLFNYAAEVAAAQKEDAKIRKSLGSGAGESASSQPSAPPAQAGLLKAIRVVGVRLVKESDEKRNLRPFNYGAGYSLVLLAEFPGSVLSVTGDSIVDTAVADDGASLLPDSDWNRKIHFPGLSSDKTAATLEIQLKTPGAAVKGLKELSGRLYFDVAGGTKEVDLGLTTLTAGATGSALGARIQSIREGWQKDGSQTMSLKLGINPNGIKALSLVAGGTRTLLPQRGYSGGGNSYTFNYESRQAFPTNGRLVAEVYDKLQTFEAPFKLENFTLLGDPPGASR